MATQILSFQKVATVPSTGLTIGRIYFETSSGIIKVATSETAVQSFGGILDAILADNILTLKRSNGADVVLDLSDVASASSVTTELAKKLNIGSSSDASTVQSYYGLKKYTDEAKASAISTANAYTDTEIAKIPAAITYKADGTTVTQSGTSTVTFAVGTIEESQVSGLVADLAAKATVTALKAVKTTADAAAPQATTYTKNEVDDKVSAAVGSVYKMKGSVDDATALQALTGVAIGDVYNVIAAGTLNGEAFEAGSNFVAVKAGAGSQTGMWDKLGGTIDLSAYAKSADVASTYETIANVGSRITSAIAGLDVADSAVSGRVVSAVSETNGKITVTRRALVAADIPELSIDKITRLQAELDDKPSKLTTINAYALTDNIVLTGEDILVGGTGALKDKPIDIAIDGLDSRMDTLETSGVKSFGGKQGAITLKAAASANGSVNLSMKNNELQAAIVGLGSAAYTASTAYATAAQGSLAASALQKASITTGSANGTIAVSGTDVAVKGLGSAAYTASTAYDAAGSANTALTSAKAYANELMAWADFA